MSGFYKYAQADPSEVAVVGPDGTEHRAGDVLARANRYVHALRAIGLQPGDAVAVVLPNGVQPIEVYLAALLAGWSYVPNNYRLSAAAHAHVNADYRDQTLRSHARRLLPDPRRTSWSGN